ncbi:MAG: 3-dehydroquinate synthase [Planctomycetia bacterium]|nr:3-dehydroquinate synthase [Planctomycetia bacterium]
MPGNAAASDPANDRSYDIVCGGGILPSIGGLVRAAGGRRAVVVSDSAVAATHAAQVLAALATAGIDAFLLEVPSGESSKSIDAAGRLWKEFARQAVDRGTHVVAVGGGVVGDLAGFVAATFARGLSVWQVPTTLVAQVDSAIGGKTGINLESGKNLVGVFWQPRGVVADIETLATLPSREFISGLAEVVKYGVILDPAFFGWLEEHAGAVLARESAALLHAVERSAAIKADVVGRDERETSGLRAALNYGHTFAHAYETAAGYGTLLHGEAVAIGMARAARLAERLGRLPHDAVARQDALLRRLQLPVMPPAGLLDAAALIEIMGRDKKTLGGKLRFVLPSRIGRVELVDGVPSDVVRGVLQQA